MYALLKEKNYPGKILREFSAGHNNTAWRDDIGMGWSRV